jgi:hypothetical protein
MAPVKSGIDAGAALSTGTGACARAEDAAAAAAATDEITAKMKFRRFKAMCLSLTVSPDSCPLVGFRLH